MIASALVAAIGDGSAFKRGRDLSAWLGIVPHQSSTGGKTRLLGILSGTKCMLGRCTASVIASAST